METKTLTGLPLKSLIDVFNEAFSDYIIPFKLTEETLAAKMLSENISLENSVGVFADEKLIAFILTGVDLIDNNWIAYNAGTGVTPAYRGNKLTEKMYAYLIPLLVAEGIIKHQLEVITENQKALAVYKKIGFAINRKFCCFKGKVKASSVNPLVAINVVDISVIDASCWDSQPAYQNTINAIRRDKENYIFLLASINTIAIGYIVYAPSTGRVKQFGVSKQYRRMGMGNAIFSYAQKQLPEKELSIINIDSSDTGTLSFLATIGFVSTVEQYEMLLG